MLLQGIFPAVTTPFYADGAVYYKKIEHNIDRYSRTPVAGMVILGSTGEAIMLSDQERRDVLRAAAEAAAPEKVLIAGTGAESVIETLRLTEYAAALNYDAALVRTPHFYNFPMGADAPVDGCRSRFCKAGITWIYGLYNRCVRARRGHEDHRGWAADVPICVVFRFWAALAPTSVRNCPRLGALRSTRTDRCDHPGEIRGPGTRCFECGSYSRF